MNAGGELNSIASYGVSSMYEPSQFEGPVDLRLDGNEGPTPSEELMDCLSAVDAEAIRRYPDAGLLEALIAERYGVAPAQVIVTAGADDALDRCCRASLLHDTTLLLTEPTFEMLARYATLVGAGVTSIPWMSGPFPTRDVVEAIDEKVRAIAIVSPNNPTGNWATIRELQEISAAAPNAILILDAVYSEFCEIDITCAALGMPNVVVVRSFSKARGLAGLRVGYAIGSAAIIHRLRCVGGPYPASGVSLQLAVEQLCNGDDDLERFVARVRFERESLIDELARLRAVPFPSQANFVLAKFDNGTWVRDGLASLGIGVRSWRNRPALDSCVRITCPGSDLGFGRLIRGLRCVLMPEALLFDMDGVLIDVSASYRQAIIDTAGSFGVAVTPEAVAQAKSEGDANNDWDVAHRLIVSAGIDVSREDVIARFNVAYNGANGCAGLREREALLADLSLLARLAAKLPLAVVTGRPRAEARRALDRFQMDPYFRTIVCMEDAPIKPDPAPVRLALARLGVSNAWLVGDTVDDVRAARGANVASLGIVAPGEDRVASRSTLMAAGAARIIRDLNELEGLLS